jgi:subtilase family serine protease
MITRLTGFRGCLSFTGSVLVLAGLLVAGGLLANRASAAGGPIAAARVALPSPVPTWIKYSTDDGPARSSVTVPFRLYLAGAAPASQLAFAQTVSEPGSKQFRHYLTPEQFTQRFGPTSTQTAAVEAWATGSGLDVTAANAHYVALSGTAPAVSSALGTSIDAFGGTLAGPTGYAPIRGASVPASIASDVIAAVGLDDDSYNSAARDLSATTAALGSTDVKAASAPRCSAWWGQHTARTPTAYGHREAPTAVCGYTPQQLREAYGIDKFTGKGATIAIVLDGALQSIGADADRFFAAHHLPGFAKGQFQQNFGPGFASSCQDGYADLPEEPLDVETAHIIAPGARVVYVAVNCSNSTSGFELNFLDAETRIVDQHLADVETDSYSTLESEYTPAMAAAWTQIFEEGAAEGIGFNFDSGDGGDDTNNSKNTPPAVTFPASDPWATAVGGTTVEIGQSGRVVGELGWGDTIDQENRAGTAYVHKLPGVFSEGSTGGRSVLFAQPAYQHGVVPGSLATAHGTEPADREVPDIAADASPITGWLIGYTSSGRYHQILEGGTSGSSPIVAALEADAKQASGQAVGFANPTLYALRKTKAIKDIVQPAKPQIAAATPSACATDGPTSQLCVITLGLDSSLREVPGFDDVTGVGAPTNQFIVAVGKG